MRKKRKPPSTVVYWFRAEPDLREKIQALAHAEERSVSYVIRRMIEKGLSQQKSLEGRA